MNEFDKTPTAIEIKEVKEHKKEIHVSEMFGKRGLTTWEYNEITRILRPAEFKIVQKQYDPTRGFGEPKIGDSNGIVKVSQIINKPGCSYFQSLNRKNAIKKIKKVFGEEPISPKKN